MSFFYVLIVKVEKKEGDLYKGFWVTKMTKIEIWWLYQQLKNKI